ncbi:hypothetical protein BK133_00760 [Paenibacillus sp. FSL H8-0548]|uniref:hypothetical protein n=1 Tax=Paenibacillus sp. FSL H8-0548 TaxID=1920422 RepID=UPI00096F2409|nr:hypothetical protein [Paenibacillus sp. FSL H8-0548]OMF38767.1 hypothetical protein BK133_00760 [Paenibacillus sp. FSL H8-0548]
MYDLIIEMAHTLWKNGFSLTALGTAVYVLLKQRKVKKKLRRYIPWLLDDDSEVKAYIHNQHLIMERLGIESSGQEGPMIPIPTNLKQSSKLSWGVKIMKEYLKKLGKTKFQALLASLIVNGISAYLFLSGTLDIDGQLNTWMPVINLTVGTISTWVYIMVEGGIDKARVGKGNTNDNTVDFTQDSAK